MKKKDADNTETASSQGLLIIKGGFEDQARSGTPPISKDEEKKRMREVSRLEIDIGVSGV
jgi:hypothetical protein